MKEEVILAWSSGKDSALALYELQRSRDYEVVALLATVTEEYDRVSMHGVRRVLLEEQAELLGLPLVKVFIPRNGDNKDYESRMRQALEEYVSNGVVCSAFGDVFLEDVRQYREDNLSKIGMQAVFPLWQRDTSELARTFISLRFKAVITCVDSNTLEEKFVGRIFDEDFLSELPPGVDPCGENGEFHSFAYEGPIFRRTVSYTTGEVVLRENRFYYCDLLPARASD